MRKNLSVKGFGLTASAGVAVLYALLTLASMLLIGMGTTGSLQAVLLGIELNTVIGIEVGLFGTVILGFALAWVFITLWSAVHTLRSGRATPPTSDPYPGRPVSRSWAFRLLIALFVLMPLTLLGMRTLALALASGDNSGAAVAHAQASNGQARAENMGSTINTAYREAEPSFTADGSSMYFNCYNGDICVSHLLSSWEEGKWTSPERLSAPIDTEYEEIEPVINASGDTLYFTSIRPIGILKGIPFLSPLVDISEVLNRLITGNGGQPLFGGLGLDDVWISHRVNGVWSEPQYINDVAGEPPVDTEYADHCLFFSADGNEAFWTSIRPDGFGSDDIWTSRRVNGKWSKPENLGANVNGPGSEHTSIPTPDGRSLYVTSDRPGGFGGEDIYITTRGQDGKWGPMVNLGPMVNGPGDDRCPAWTPDLKYFLFDSIRAGGHGAKDIWWLPFKAVKGYPLAGSGEKALETAAPRAPD